MSQNIIPLDIDDSRTDIHAHHSRIRVNPIRSNPYRNNYYFYYNNPGIYPYYTGGMGIYYNNNIYRGNNITFNPYKKKNIQIEKKDGNKEEKKIILDPFKEKLSKEDFVSFIENEKSVENCVLSLDKIAIENLDLLLLNIISNIENFLASPYTLNLISKLIDMYDSGFISTDKGPDKNTKIFNFLLSFFSKRIDSITFVKSYVNIIQKLINKLKSPCNNFIYEEINTNFLKLAKTRSGSNVIQIAFSLGTEEQQEKLLILIFKNSFLLIDDPYGHYLYKLLLDKEKNGEKYYGKIFSIIFDYIYDFTKKQLSSTIIQKLLDSNDIKIRNTIIEKLAGNEKDILELIFNEYGNYLIQKIIEINEPKHIIKLIDDVMHKNKKIICGLPYGRILFGKIHFSKLVSSKNQDK